MSAIVRGNISTPGTTGSGTTVTTTWATKPQAGSTILVFIQPGAADPTNVVDNGFPVTTFIKDVGVATGQGAYIYRGSGVQPVGPAYGVTVTTGAAHTIQAVGIEYSQVRRAPEFINTGSATSVNVTTNAVVGSLGDLYFGGFSDPSALNPETITFNSGGTFTEQYRNTNGSLLWPCAMADGILAAGGSQSMSWTLGDSVGWVSVIACYRAEPDNDSRVLAGMY